MDRFWSKVEKSEDCWNWTGAKSSFGHGRFKIDGKLYSPHRLVYEWKYGKIPKDMMICHHCDNPSCVKLEHLFLGTRSDNMKDAYRKGRITYFTAHLFGEKHGGSKLTEKQVAQIREEYKKGNTTYRKLGKKYDIDYSTIGKIIRGKRWMHSAIGAQ